MRCEQFEQRLQRCLDRRGVPSGDPALHRHARVCRRCRGMLAASTRLADGLDLLELPVPDEGFSERVVRQIRIDRGRPGSRRRLVAAILAVAASLLFVFLPQFFRRDDPAASSSARVPAVGGVPPVAGSLAVSSAANTFTLTAGAQKGIIGDVRMPLAPWHSWPTTWSLSEWNPMDNLAVGLTPITVPLGVAVEEIRRTIPLGRAERSSASPGESVQRSLRPDGTPVA